MRMRIIAAAVVLGLGIVGITLAQQQAGEQPKDQAGDRAKLRAQVARIRAAVEVLELEHGVDTDMLRETMKDVKNAEIMASVKGPMKQQVESLLGQSIEAMTEASEKKKEALKAAMGGKLPAEFEGIPSPSDFLKEMFVSSDATAKLGRPVIDRLRNDFLQKAAELAEKRLELAELEKRYNETR